MMFPIKSNIRRIIVIVVTGFLIVSCGESDTPDNTLLSGSDNISNPEPIKSFASAIVLQPDLIPAVQASIQPANDIDLYKWSAKAGQAFTISVNSPQAVRLYIYHADTSRVYAINDDSTTSSDSSLTYRCPLDGIYYVKVKSFAQNDTFSYSVSLKSGNAFSGGDLYEPDSYSEPLVLKVDSNYVQRVISPRYDYDYMTFRQKTGQPYLVTIINTQMKSNLYLELRQINSYNYFPVPDTTIIAYQSVANYMPTIIMSNQYYYQDTLPTPYLISVKSASLQSDIYEPDTSILSAPAYTEQDTGMIRIIEGNHDIDWIRIDIPTGFSAKVYIKNYSGTDVSWTCMDTLPYGYYSNYSTSPGRTDSMPLYSSRSYILNISKYQYSSDSLASCLIRCKVIKVAQ